MRRLVGLALCTLPASVFAAPCTDGSEIRRTFANGASWEFCWTVDVATGVEINEAWFTTIGGLRRRVIGRASLAQARVSRSDGSNTNAYVGNATLGGALQSLGPSQCPAGTRLSASAGSIACLQQRARGYASKAYSLVVQGEEIALTALLSLGEGELVQRWSLRDDGVFEARAGFAPTLRYGPDEARGWPVQGGNDVAAIATMTNWTWRLDVDLGTSAGDDRVQTMEARPAGGRLYKEFWSAYESTEFAARFDANTKRSWRVVDTELNGDGRPRSYHLEPIETGFGHRAPSADPWSASDFFVTRARDCERRVTGNPGGCASRLPDYVNGESIDGADVVLWYRATSFHLPRSEDRDRARVGWAGVQLIPRDWIRQGEF